MKNSFTEYTYTDGENEIMVHHRISDFKIIAVYMYADQIDSIYGNNVNSYDGQKGKLTPFKWTKGKNPLFIHLPKKSIRRFVAEFIESGELVCDEE